MTGRPRPLPALGAAVTLALLLALVAASLWHLELERDEGYMSYGAWLVAQGELPYRDFMFPQQPYHPLVFSLVMALFGPSLVAARVLSALCFVALAVTLTITVARHAGDSRLALWTGCLFACNTMALFWYPRAKQYALTDLLLFLGFVLVLEARRRAGADGRPRSALLMAAGVLAGASLHVRLLTAPAVLVLAAAAARPTAARWRPLGALWFSTGMALASTPFLLLLVQAPGHWLFDTVRFQTLVRPDGSVLERGLLAAAALGRFFKYPVLAVLGLGAVTAAALELRARRAGSPRAGYPWQVAAWLLATLVVTALACHPTQGQYLVMTIPYLAFVSSPLVARGLAALGQTPTGRLAASLALALCIVLGSAGALGWIAEDRHRDFELGLGPFLEYQEFMTAQVDVGAGTTLAWWPGYLLVRGMERHPGGELGRPSDRVADSLDRNGYRAHRLRHPDQVADDIAQGEPLWIVTGLDAPPDLGRLMAGRYALQRRFGAIEVFRRVHPAAESRRP